MNFDYFFKDLDKIPEVIISVLVAYLALILYTRMSGLKSYSKMSSYDFVHTLAIGSLFAATISMGKPGLGIGVSIIGLAFVVKVVLAKLKNISPFIEKATGNEPLFLMYEGKVLKENLEKSRISESELKGKLREANVFRLSEVKAVILETIGDVSVLHSDKENAEVDSYIIDNVRMSA